jgi:hypothetical protein
MQENIYIFLVTNTMYVESQTEKMERRNQNLFTYLYAGREIYVCSIFKSRVAEYYKKENARPEIVRNPCKLENK